MIRRAAGRPGPTAGREQSAWGEARAWPRLRAAVIVLAAATWSEGATDAREVTRAPAVTAFTNVTVIPVETEGALRGQTVVVRGDRIEAVGPVGLVPVPDGATTVDGTGRFLTPGLVDAHVHLDPFVGARPDFGDAPLFLAHGVTTVFNLRGDADILDWRRRIRAGELLAPNLFTSGEFVNEPRVNTPGEVQKEVEAQVEAGYDLIKFREVIDFAHHRVATTGGLAMPAYLRLAETARRAGVPVLGHAPFRVGLDGLLRARTSLAHTNELANLYFLPPLDLSRGGAIRFARWGFLTLAGSLALWGLLGLLSRLRQTSVHLRGLGLGASALVVAVLAAGVWVLAVPPGRYYGSVPLLLVLSLLAIVLVLLASAMLLRAVQAWRQAGGSVMPKLLASLAGLSTLALAGSVGYWTAFAWRGSERSVERVAQRCRQAGIWVESTLVLYETGMAQRPGYRMDEQRHSPGLRFLPSAMQEEWRGIPGFVPPAMVRLWGRHPEFVRHLLGALHRAGVPILAGTDALGVPFVIPGSSLHRELGLLRESGLSNAEVLWSATAGPARFVGGQGEFGTVGPGRRADLLLLAGNPLDDLAWLEKPLAVMVRGVYLTRADLDRRLEVLASAR